MLSIGIGELQKNISIFQNLTEILEIVDKRTKQPLAFVYPIQKQVMTTSLAGKYKNRVPLSTLSIEQIKEESFAKAMEEKYGSSS
ncbi:MAG: hypothetical protein NTZ60_05550 [Campylobacterales bacterium]|nr:hypothetical protein [Campylobacterales bacterium]